MTGSPSVRPAFRMGAEGLDPARTLFVDGTADGFRTLSHWPGHRTPEPLRRALSTASALAWAAASADERERWVGSFDVVANNHYDTDGVLSACAVLRPDLALAHRELLEAAAATGDFGTWNGPRALALELTVMALPDHPESPLAAELDGLEDLARWELCTRWAVEHLEQLVADPFARRSLWADRFERIRTEIEALEAGRGPTCERVAELDLAVVRATAEPARIALHHAAGPTYRVLLLLPGPRALFCYRDESWFDLPEPLAAPRVPLEGLVAALNEAERAAGGDPCWWADDLQRPVVELRHRPEVGGSGFGGDFGLVEDPPTRLDADRLVAIVRDELARSAG